MKKNNLYYFFMIMIIYVFFVSYASDYGTDVEIVGNGSEEYTVTVPAKLGTNSFGDVIVEGSWASNRIINVTADESVEITNKNNIFNKSKVNVNFLGIHANGNDSTVQNIKEVVSVGKPETNILFGTWSGKFNYNVDISDDSYDELYNGRTYLKVFHSDEVLGTFPTYIVPYEDNSAFIYYDEESWEYTESDYMVFGEQYVYANDLYLKISEDRTTVTYNDESTGDELVRWELVLSDDVLDNTFPVTYDFKKMKNNERIEYGGKKYLRISDNTYSKSDFAVSNISISSSYTENTAYVPLQTIQCMDDFDSCNYIYENMDISISVFVVEKAVYYDGVMVVHPGVYIEDVFFNFEDSEYKDADIYVSVERDNNIYDLEWNTMDVANNTSVIYNDLEYVKVSNDTKNYDYFKNSFINFVVDGILLSYEKKSFVIYNGGDFYLISSNDVCKNIIVVKKPSEINGVYFDEVGVYAFNFGKYGKDYNIQIGKRYAPTLKNNIKYGSKYTFDSNYLIFYNDGIVLENGIELSYYIIGNTIRINDSLGIVSNDGTSIKFYKYLGRNIMDFDDFIVTLEK